MSGALATATPLCRHFGVCGGCQYQDVAYQAQLALKRDALHAILQRAGIQSLPDINIIGSPEPYHYRNRIRLRLERVAGTPRAGYSLRGSFNLIPIVECPIAAPLLWNAAVQFTQIAAEDAATSQWLDASDEAEFFCDADEKCLQLTLLTSRREVPTAKIDNLFCKLLETIPQLSGIALAKTDPHSGRITRILAEAGAAGLLYRTADESYWISRGCFFQVNRFLLAKLVDLVCAGRSGKIAWDLFAGVGLFSRVLTRSFGQVTAVETSPSAALDLNASLTQLGPQHRALQATTEDFLRKAVLDRERPQLIVLDPPRAGLGTEVCALLQRFGTPEIVYVSCDPATLARDLATLTQTAYIISEIHLVDLFPQTAHMETVVVLHRP